MTLEDINKELSNNFNLVERYTKEDSVEQRLIELGKLIEKVYDILKENTVVSTSEKEGLLDRLKEITLEVSVGVSFTREKWFEEIVTSLTELEEILLPDREVQVLENALMFMQTKRDELKNVESEYSHQCSLIISDLDVSLEDKKKALEKLKEVFNSKIEEVLKSENLTENFQKVLKIRYQDKFDTKITEEIENLSNYQDYISPICSLRESTDRQQISRTSKKETKRLSLP